jgi:NitT/TauT family transport system ATP-binding protein
MITRRHTKQCRAPARAALAGDPRRIETIRSAVTGMGVEPGASTGRALLQVDNVTLQYKTARHLVTATWRVGFEVYEADRFVLLGPSGCGKSTLLKAIGGFIAPVEGSIRLAGKAIDRPGPDRMMVFQEFDQLLPWHTVLGNVMFPLLRNGRMSRKHALAHARSLLAKVNLSKFENVHPHMLSGGMKQRCAIARALAMEPAVLLMDEPFAALDALTRRNMQQDLVALWDDVRFTVIFVTHSIEEALLIGNRILVMSPHPGQVKAELDAEELGFSSIGTPAFEAVQRRVHGLLFADRIETALAMEAPHV